jgi:hypothetical protein
MSIITAGLIASLAVMLIACAFAIRLTRVTDQEPVTVHRCAFEGCDRPASEPMRSLFSNTIATVCARCAEESEANGWAVRA